jgi:hypothetical protein
MIRKKIKEINKNETINKLIKKYNIEPNYIIPTKKMILRGIIIGFIIGVIPMPMQLATVLLITPFFKFNVPIAMFMCLLSNPLTMPIMYYIEYKTGALILSMEMLNVEMTIEWFKNNFQNIIIPLYIGTLFFQITITPILYFITKKIWEKSVLNERNKRRNT